MLNVIARHEVPESISIFKKIPVEIRENFNAFALKEKI